MTDELKTEPRKKYLIYVPVSLWDRLAVQRQKHNTDIDKVGPISVNNLFETALKQYLERVEDKGLV